jgi:hypothetical protein
MQLHQDILNIQLICWDEVLQISELNYNAIADSDLFRGDSCFSTHLAQAESSRELLRYEPVRVACSAMLDQHSMVSSWP